MAQQKFQHPDGRGFSAEEGSDEAERLAGLGFAPVDAYLPQAATAADPAAAPADSETSDQEKVNDDGGTSGDGQPADPAEKADRRPAK